MKLVRNSTRDLDSCSRDAGLQPLLRGRILYFTIENAAERELVAMENMLVEAGFQHDRCPIYDEGISCGFWVDIADADLFRATYRTAKTALPDVLAQEPKTASGDRLMVMLYEGVVGISQDDSVTIGQETTVIAKGKFGEPVTVTGSVFEILNVFEQQEHRELQH